MFEALLEIAKPVFERVTFPIALGMLLPRRGDEEETDDDSDGDSDELEGGMEVIDWGHCGNHRNRRRRRRR